MNTAPSRGQGWRRDITILSALAVLACSACGGGRDAKKADFESREHEFQKKSICAELGRQRLALDSREEEKGIARAVKAEWCYNIALNTCIYSGKVDIFVAPGDPNEMEKLVLSLQSTIDLLTNRTLISVDRTKSNRVELEEYERKRSELFGKCQ
jgi:hypothetical protein